MATKFDTKAGRLRYNLREVIRYQGRDHWSSLGYGSNLAEIRAKADRHDCRAIVVDSDEVVHYDNRKAPYGA